MGSTRSWPACFCCSVLAPIGRAMSLDRVRAVRAAKRKDLTATLPPYASPWTGACTQADAGPDGGAVLLQRRRQDRAERTGGTAMPCGSCSPLDEHYSKFILDVLASHYWLVNLATYGTILIEIAFPFLIWQRATRPYLLVAAPVSPRPVRPPDGIDLLLVRHGHGAYELRSPRVARPPRRMVEAPDRSRWR